MVVKRSSFGSALHYLNGRPATTKRYLQKFYPPHDWSLFERRFRGRLVGGFFYDNPIQSKVIIKDFLKSNDAKLEIVTRIFITGKSKIVFIVGARGGGKTATAFMFAEQVHNETSRIIYYVASNVEKSVRQYFPSWMHIVSKIQDVPKDCFAIIDESAIQFSSRDSMQEDSKLLGKELAIARHRGIFLIFITQHIAMTDINLDRLKDLILWKQSNDYSFGTRDKTTKAGKFWEKVRNMMAPRDQPEVLFEYPAMRRFIHFSHGLPECWSEELSRSWKDSNLAKKKEAESIKPKKKQLEVLRI